MEAGRVAGGVGLTYPVPGFHDLFQLLVSAQAAAQVVIFFSSKRGTDKLTDIRRQLPDEKIKYIQTISISIGNHSVGIDKLT